jgi:hypothetical protein
MDMQIEGKSRLESVKEAIKDEIKRMKFEKENIKIGLITFGNIVTLQTSNSKKNQSINIPT